MKRSGWKSKLWDCLLVAAAVAIFYVFQIPCLFRLFLHIPCPGCGMTRAYLSLLRGDWRGAFGYHPMFWSVPLLALWYCTDGHLFRRKWPDRILTAVLLLGFLAHWIHQLCLL